jgi:beta-galactosidase
MFGEECVAGIQAEHRAELYTAIGIIPVGKGRIIISTPDILGAIGTGRKSAVVAKKLLMNYIEYAVDKKE